MTRDQKATIMAAAMIEKAKTIKWTAHKMEEAYKMLALAGLDAVEPEATAKLEVPAEGAVSLCPVCQMDVVRADVLTCSVEACPYDRSGA